jgi:hypothetical protein
MLSATDVRTQTINSVTTETEIFLINLNILNSTAAGNSTVSVTSTTNTAVFGSYVIGTPITAATGNVYYSVWQGNSVSTNKTAQMNKVIDYYAKLGYTINRRSDDGASLYWLISW